MNVRTYVDFSEVALANQVLDVKVGHVDPERAGLLDDGTICVRSNGFRILAVFLFVKFTILSPLFEIYQDNNKTYR